MASYLIIPDDQICVNTVNDSHKCKKYLYRKPFNVLIQVQNSVRKLKQQRFPNLRLFVRKNSLLRYELGAETTFTKKYFLEITSTIVRFDLSKNKKVIAKLRP